jgi:hypothetical protein
MAQIIEGTGRLRIGGKDKGPCRFHLTVSGGGDAPKSARGTLAVDMVTAMEAFDANSGVTIVRDDTGFEMSILLTELSGESVFITLSGPPE